MPLIVMSGLPASGKSTRAKQLEEYFKSCGKEVHLISENVVVPSAGFSKNEYFVDSQKEKQVRSDLKSSVMRQLNQKDVVILDAGNYIKGYRYELFCASKAARGTQCTLFCSIQKDQAWKFNQERNGTEENLDTMAVLNNSCVPYTDKLFEELCMRFEEPQSNSRWDRPLFVTYPDDKLEFMGIYNTLYKSEPLTPNQSTQNPPLSATNYLFELDRCSQDIITSIVAARKLGITGPLPVPGSNTKVDISANINVMQLNRLRRQFLCFHKVHSNTDNALNKIPQLFAQFLNANCGQYPKFAV